jgi:hypothetical protein
VTPAKRGKGNSSKTTPEAQERARGNRCATMTLAQRLKRVFHIDVETCGACGGTLRFIACIDDPVIIEKILSHLNKKTSFIDTNLLPESWAPP